MKTKNKLTKGFTLIELLVVVLIIGILAAIALPQYKMAVRKTEFAQIQAITNALFDAQNRYFLLHNSFAHELETLDVNLPSGYDIYIHPNTLKFYILPNKTICTLNTGDNIYCATKDRKNAYFVVPFQSPLSSSSMAGKKYCWACSLDTTDQYNKLCKNVTGQEEGERLNGLITDYYCRGYIYQF